MGTYAATQLVIVTKSLANGSHPFDFQIDKGFFEAFDNTEIKCAALKVGVNVRKMGPLQLEVQVAVNGEVEVACDRCLDNVAIPVIFTDSLEEEEVLEMTESESGELDLTQYVYDSVCVGMPLQRIHAEGACNPEMLALWQSNNEQTPRESGAFEGLKDLLNRK